MDAEFAESVKRWNTPCYESGEHAFIPHPYNADLTICRHCGGTAFALLAATQKE